MFNWSFCVGNIVERMLRVALSLDWPVIHPLLSRGLFWQKRNTSYSPTCSNYRGGYYTHKTWNSSIQSTEIQKTHLYLGIYVYMWPNVDSSKYCLLWPEKLCVDLFPDLRSGVCWPNGCRKRGTVGFLCSTNRPRHLLRETDTALVVVSKRCLWWRMSTKVSSLVDDKCSGARRRSRALIS